MLTNNSELWETGKLESLDFERMVVFVWHQNLGLLYLIGNCIFSLSVLLMLKQRINGLPIRFMFHNILGIRAKLVLRFIPVEVSLSHDWEIFIYRLSEIVFCRATLTKLKKVHETILSVEIQCLQTKECSSINLIFVTAFICDLASAYWALH